MIAKEQYEQLTVEELEDLNFTGVWELDKRRFTKEFEKNLEALLVEISDEDGTY